jgi:hypothetical protein
MSNINIFDIRPSHIFYYAPNGDVVVKPNTPYFNTKLIKFDGERISNVIESNLLPHPDDFDFVEKITIQETFNEMIFNITIGNESITTRPTMADSVVASIDNQNEIIQIYNKYAGGCMNIELLESVLKHHGERIKIVDAGYIVDDVFLVDRKANAWNWNGEINSDIDTNLSTGGICIVVNKTMYSKIDTASGPVTIDPIGYQIIAKVSFLLNPNLNDHTFMQQIPDKTKEILKRQDPNIPKKTGIFSQHRLDGDF